MQNDNKRTTIVLADDHPLFRKGLAEVLLTDPSLLIAAEASNGSEALHEINKNKPDVLILDISMPKMNGLEVIKEINKLNIYLKIIVLTMYEDERMFNKALDLGIHGYVLKESAVNDILRCVRTVIAGKRYISPSISDYLIQRKRSDTYQSDFHFLISNLTLSERKIIRLISENKTTKDIAKELSVSIHTIENHRANICRKLKITGNNALLRFALENKGLL